MGLDLGAPFPKRSRLKTFDYIGTYAYSVTILTKDRVVRFKDSQVVDGLVNILIETTKSERFKILTYCFMPDHLHLLVVGEDNHSNLKKFKTLFKQKSGYRFKRNYGEDLWHISYYDHTLRKEEDLQKVAFYILQNPVRKGIVSDFREYPFSGSLGTQPLRADQSGLKP
jgi:putative transposase